METTYDIVVVLDQFQQSADQHWEALSEIDRVVGEHLISVEGYLDPVSDNGVLVLRFSLRSVLGIALEECVSQTGLPTIVPGILPIQTRYAFYLEYLSRYCVYVQRHATENSSRSVLVRTLMAMAAYDEYGADADEYHRPEMNPLTAVRACAQYQGVSPQSRRLAGRRPRAHRPAGRRPERW